jgi:hypothetical protein
MSGLSSFAPHLGAALGAGLMLAASLAFNAGAGGADAPPRAASESAAAAFELRTAAPAPASAEEAPQAIAAAPDRPTQAARDAAADGAPRLAVIMDDIADLASARRALALPVPVTISVLPYAEDAPDIAALVTAAGGELFIHLPMEPVGLDDPGPYALTKALDAGALAARLSFALARAPGAVGFNNHMGSRMTADRDAMDAVFASMDERWAGLVFVDSLTHPRSQAAAAADAAGLTALKRDVFLDHDRAPAAVDAQIEAALNQAMVTGQAIAIAHPRPETFEALEGLAARAEAAGVRIVPVAALAQDAPVSP